MGIVLFWKVCLQDSCFLLSVTLKPVTKSTEQRAVYIIYICAQIRKPRTLGTHEEKTFPDLLHTDKRSVPGQAFAI